MKKLNNILLLTILLCSISSCDDILEEDITNDVVEVNTPKEGTVIEGNTVQFLWQNLEGADKYRLQVITDNQLKVVDSLLPKTELAYNLDPGNYQWRIRAENFAYKTAYTFPVNFTVEETTDLSGQSVALQSPSDNLYTNTAITIFNWKPIKVAEHYSFQLIKKANGGEQAVFQDDDIKTSSITLEASLLAEDAEYLWKVKAINTTSETAFAERTFYLDTTVPNQPTLSSPNDKDTVAPSTVTFNWANGVDPGNIKSTITNTLEIATDNNFNNIVHTASTINNSLQYEFTSKDTYYWRVIAKDKASNKSDYSIIRSIIVE
jgi:hypothetical protein